MLGNPVRFFHRRKLCFSFIGNRIASICKQFMEMQRLLLQVKCDTHRFVSRQSARWFTRCVSPSPLFYEYREFRNVNSLSRLVIVVTHNCLLWQAHTIAIDCFCRCRHWYIARKWPLQNSCACLCRKMRRFVFSQLTRCPHQSLWMFPFQMAINSFVRAAFRFCFF